MACIVKINGKEMSEAEFYSWLVDGGFDGLVQAGKIDLKAVGQVQSKSQIVTPTSGKWVPSLTEKEVDEKTNGAYTENLDKKVSEGAAHATQIATTKGTYIKWANWLKDNVSNIENAKVLDVGAGFGHIHKPFKEILGLDAESYEPFYNKEKYLEHAGVEKPNYVNMDASDVPKGKFDVVVNNAVLNVIPADIRDNVVRTIGKAMKPGGMGIINAMNFDYVKDKIKKIEAGSKNIQLSDSEVFIYESGKYTYQKGFQTQELVGYVQDVLGDDYVVSPAPSAIKSMATVVIEKKASGQIQSKSQAADVKIKKADDFDSTFEHTVYVGGKEVGRIWYDRSLKAWVDPYTDKYKTGPYSLNWVVGNILGDTKEEAANELIKRSKEENQEEAKKSEVNKPEPKKNEIEFSKKDPILNTFLNELNRKLPLQVSPFSSKEFIYGDKASLEFNRFDKEEGANEINLQDIVVFKKGIGEGKSVMKDITDVADKLGITLKLEAKPFGTGGGLDKRSLIDFYKRNGFSVDLQEAFGGDFDTEEELIDYVVSDEQEALEMKREPQGFKSKSQTKEQATTEVLSNMRTGDVKFSSKSQLTTPNDVADSFEVDHKTWDDAFDKMAEAALAKKPDAKVLDAGVEFIKAKYPNFDAEAFRKLVETNIEIKRASAPVSTRKVRKTFSSMNNNPALKNAVASLNEADFIYDSKTESQTTKDAESYIEAVGVEQAFLDVVDNNFSHGLTDDVKVGVANIVITMIDGGIAKALEAKDQATVDELWRDMQQISEAIAKFGTEAGRAVNAFKRFTANFANPATAVFYAMKTLEAGNVKARENTGAKDRAKTVVEDVKTKVKAGKKSVAKSVAKNLPKNEMKGLIAKGIDSKTSEAVKNKISTFFDNLKDTFSSIDLSRPTKPSPIKSKSQTINAAVKFVEKVKEEFMKVREKSMTLSQAMMQVSADMIDAKELTPTQAAELRTKMTGAVNQNKAPVQSAQAKALKEATQAFNAEEAIKKSIEKERARIASISAKEVEAQTNRIETQRAKLLFARINEERRVAEAKIKEREALQRALEKETKRLADFRAKEAQDVLDRVDKLALQRSRAAVEQAKKDRKALEDKIKKLTSEVVNSNEELVEQIIDEYLDLRADAQTNNAILIDMVKEKLGLDGVKAKEVATQIANGVNAKIKNKLFAKYGASLTEEERLAKKEGRKAPLSPMDQLIRASKLGVMDAQTAVMNLFQKQYGITSFTQQDAAKVKQISRKIAESQTPERRNKAVSELASFLSDKNPFTFSELMDEFWYFDRLSSVLTLVMGTADVNNRYNWFQLATNAVEMPLTTLISNLRMAKGQTASSVAANTFSNLLYGLSKGVIQQFQTNKSEKDGLDNFVNVLWASKGNFLSESLAYLQEVLANGQGGITEIEKPFEAKRVSDFDIKKWFEQSKAGDAIAKKKIAQYMFKVINSPMRGVPRILAGSDMFFGSIVKNSYVPLLLTEKYYKEGLRNAALREKVLQDLVSSREAVETAQNNAVDARMTSDITIEKVNNTWVVADRGKIKGSGFGSLAEATDYAKDNVANRGLQYRKDLIYFLNKSIGDDVIDAANRIAQRDLLSGPAEGSAGKAYKAVQNINEWAQEKSDFLNRAAKLNRGPEWMTIWKMMKTGQFKDVSAGAVDKFIASTRKLLAVLVKSTGRLVAFTRVGFNLMRKSSNYLLPIGLARYGRAVVSASGEGPGKSLLGVEYKNKLTMVEQDKILAQTIMGSAYVLVFTTAMSAFADLFRDDEDKEKYDKVRSKKLAAEYKASTGEEMPKEALDYVLNLRPGQVVGSLAFMDGLAGGRKRKQFYTNSGLLKENSIFKGIDAKGNYIFESIIGTPESAQALMLGTYTMYMALTDPEEKSGFEGTMWALYQPLSTFFDMSIGQGIGKLVAGDKNVIEKGMAVLQTVVLDNFEIGNPDIIKKPLQYFDQKYRPNETLKDFIEKAETTGEGVNNWFLNKVRPLYGAWYSAMKAPQAYGMFGEELFKIPNQEQGFVSKKMAEYFFSDKNLPQKSMYDWLGANGYEKIWRPSKFQPFVDERGKAKLMNQDKLELYGRTAGEKTFLELQKRKLELQRLWSEAGKEDFIREVDSIFKRNYIETYMRVEGLLTDEMLTRYAPVQLGIDKEKQGKMREAIETRKGIAKALPLTPEAQKEMNIVKRQSGTKIYKVFELLKPLQKKDAMDKLISFYAHEAISESDLEKAVIMLGLGQATEPSSGSEE